jgi:hypothetical protein
MQLIHLKTWRMLKKSNPSAARPALRVETLLEGAEMAEVVAVREDLCLAVVMNRATQVEARIWEV